MINSKGICLVRKNISGGKSNRKMKLELDYITKHCDFSVVTGYRKKKLWFVPSYFQV